jgi:hypothetical protein
MRHRGAVLHRAAARLAPPAQYEPAEAVGA